MTGEYDPSPKTPSRRKLRSRSTTLIHQRKLIDRTSRSTTLDHRRELGHRIHNTLPKIHKYPSCPPGRPIVASTNSLLSPLAITLEKILSPLVPLIKSYLKDTSDFLKSLRDLGPISEGCLLVTMDVNSLYTSINHEDGIRAVMSFLTEHTNFSHHQRDFCRDILTLILTKNFFIFEDQFFIQKRGTAMGSNMAPPYANIFMDSFEKGDLNSSLPGLTFSISHSRSSMNFLDTMVNVNSEGFLETDLYVKPTDRMTTVTHNILKNLYLNLNMIVVERIVSKPEVSRMRHKEMDLKFLSRGYPPHILYTQRNTTRSQRDQNASRLAFAYPHIKEFNSIPIISNKRCPSIRDKLVRADVGSSKRELTQSFLHTPEWNFSLFGLSPGISFTHPHSGKRFSIKGHFTCNTTFVVYLIKCPCGLGYVGETTQHIRDASHNINQLLDVVKLYFQFRLISYRITIRRGGDRIKKLKERESFWIHTLQTLTPLGLNREYEGDIAFKAEGRAKYALRRSRAEDSEKRTVMERRWEAPQRDRSSPLSDLTSSENGDKSGHLRTTLANPLASTVEDGLMLLRLDEDFKLGLFCRIPKEVLIGS
ncbi:unnamed protein product, partial [Ranitomeya imitator]